MRKLYALGVLVMAGVLLAEPATADDAAFNAVRRERAAAQSADAGRLVPERWLQAERDFSAAKKRLASGNAESANKLAGIAADSYREAQLQALRSRWLSPARTQLIAAERMKAARYAPQTLAEAKARLSAAEAALAGNRSQPERAAAEIEAARLAATHALQLATAVRQVDTDEQSLEDLVLALEDSVRRMAEAAGLPALNIAGNPAGSEALVSGMRELRTRSDNAEQELGQCDRQLKGMEEELRELDMRLGSATSERDRLLMGQASEQRMRELVSMLEQQFRRDEAQVIQSPDGLILRLTGLSFQSGSVQLDRSAIPLVHKAAQAIALFPRAVIVIEGHTDSAGDAASNQRLSAARAQAVQSRLLTELALPAGRLQVLGLGESRPVASNASSTGRKQNRRIDIVIQTASEVAAP